MTLDDERVQFYLRHREQLEEWQALRSVAAAAIDEWLIALRPDIESLVAEIGGDVELVADLEEEQLWPGFFLKRRAWPGEKREATALIGLEWSRGKTLLGPSSAPYVGVRVDRATSIGRALREDTEFQNNRRLRKDKGLPWWAALGYVLPREQFPEHADQYRAVLLNSIGDVWNAYASDVDRAVSKT
jgi:hypothetical protein